MPLWGTVPGSQHSRLGQRLASPVSQLNGHASHTLPPLVGPVLVTVAWFSLACRRVASHTLHCWLAQVTRLSLSLLYLCCNVVHWWCWCLSLCTVACWCWIWLTFKTMFVEFSIYFFQIFGWSFPNRSGGIGDVVLPKLIHFMIPRLTNPYRITIFYHKMQQWKQCN